MDSINQESFKVDTETNFNNMDYLMSTESKYNQDIAHIMRAAHRNLQNIEQTSREVQKVLINITKRETSEKNRKKTELERNEVLGKVSTSRPRKVTTVNVVVNNIAGVDKFKRKLEVILDGIRHQNIDIFLGQEMNIQTRDKSFTHFLQRKETRDFHFATSESSYKFQSYKKPGGTFCITGSRLKPRVMKKVINHMGRWAGFIYQLKGVNVAFLSIYHTVENTYHSPNLIHSQQLAILLLYSLTGLATRHY